MSYQEYQPHPALTSYIDAYWVIRTEKVHTSVNRIFPDGCIDIIVNAGSDFLSANGTFTMKNGSSQLPKVWRLTVEKVSILNQFFLSKHNNKQHPLADVLSVVNNLNGRITVENLAKSNGTGKRQLERVFKESIGLTPKEYINFVRYQFALRRIQTNAKQNSLLEIAYDAGYYDHSHLTNDVKKYSGLLPSQL